MKRIHGLAVWACLALGADIAHAAVPAVATGGWHSLAVAVDGTVRTWGDDSAGALGIGRPLVSASPTLVAGLSGVVVVAAAGARTVALKSDGTVWSWGGNEYGELGDGSITPRSTPVQAQGLTDVVQVAVGRFHTVARRRDGSVWTWGSNNYGEMGDTEPGRRTPAPLAGLTSVVEVAAGGYHTLIRTADGTVWALGANDNGQLGDGAPTAPYTGRASPVRVVGLDNVIQLVGGGFHSVALKADGTVWTWGENSGGSLGDGTTTNRSSPVRVSSLAGIVEVSAGYKHTLARGADGTVWVWGDGGYGQLGDGLYNPRPVPFQLPMTGIVQLSAGFLHSVAVASDGGLFAWGANGNGQIGDGTTFSRPTPSRVAGIADLTGAATAAFHTVALKRDGTVLTWGDNSLGQLGNAVYTFRATPAVVNGLPPVIAVAGALFHSLALTADGNVYAWGNNLSNMFQDDSVGHSTPQRLAGISNVAAISAGAFHSLALMRDGTVRAWGSNYRGLLGTGNDFSISVPVPVLGLANITQVSAGGTHSLALRADGTVWAWGEGDAGQLGDGGTSDRAAPVQVVGITDAVEVAAGPAHSLARLRDGTVMAWGRNVEGALGDGTNVTRLTPVRVIGLAGVTAIAAGRDFSLALVAGGVWAWGINYTGGIGCPGCVGNAGPIAVPGVDRIAAMATKNSHVLLLRTDGTVFAWGAGGLGQLGDGTLVDRESPVAVLRVGGGGSIAAGDWFLDLNPALPKDIPADKVPPFLVVASGVASSLVADIRYRTQDVGTTASTFVFALAPATMVRGAVLKDADPRFAWKARGGSKADPPVQCALAQLNAQGQLVAVSAASLQAYVSGVLSAQGQSVTILNASNPNVAGATFYVGYGANGNAMLTNGTTRSVVSVAGTVACRPQPPQTGWWFNPAEGGRGFSIEARGNRLFFAAFHYEADGRATWNFAGGVTSLDGSLFTADFLSASGGQTLTGAYRLPGLGNAGTVTFAFSDAANGTMIWPGGTVAIERQPFIPDGLTAPPQSGLPEAGWWWNPAESGRGFFIEWQGGFADIAGYMYDAQGRPTWYISALATPDPRRITGNWWTFANGQAMGQPYRAATRTSDNAGALDIQFSSATTATMTLPDGRRIPLVRQAF